LVKNGRDTILFKCLAGCDPRAILEEFRARGLWEENAAVAPDQQRPVKPMAAAPAHQPDVAALALWRDGKAVSGTVAEQFLRARGLTIDPPSLRPATVLHLDRYPLPALVAAAPAPAPVRP